MERHDTYAFNEFTVDTKQRGLFKNGEFVRLQNAQYQVLRALVEAAASPEHVKRLTAEEILKVVSLEGVNTVTAIRTAIWELNKTIGPPSAIKNIPRLGYQFARAVRVLTTRPIHAPSAVPLTAEERARQDIRTTPCDLTESDHQIIEESEGRVCARGELLSAETEQKDGAAFRILLLFDQHDRDPLTITRRPAHSRTGVDKYSFQLDIDLTGQCLGIWSNAGKDWLDRRFKLKGDVRDPERVDRLLMASQTIHDFLMGRRTDYGDVLRWRDVPTEAPLRWASGGTLLVAKFEHDYWAVLFFRDRKPVGLNIANGASENVGEWLNPGHLSSRELAEEVSTQRGPFAKRGVLQYYLTDDYDGSLLDPNVTTPDEIGEFMKAHNDLRAQHDDTPVKAAREERKTHRIETDFSVRVKHDRYTSRSFTNFLLSVNPMECGIEAIRMASIDLETEKTDWLADGELVPSSWHAHPYLLRRPLILLRLSALKERLDRHSSFGKPIDRQSDLNEGEPFEDFLDCKRLADFDFNDVRLFVDFGPDGKDLDNRRRRQHRIEDQWVKSGLSENDLKQPNPGAVHDAKSKAWHQEWHQIQTFMSTYGAILLNAPKQQSGSSAWSVRLPGGPFTTLCPVTWKSLELMFRWGYECA